MPFVNLDDNYPEHPKNWSLSDLAARLQTAAICYCNRQKTDGQLPKSRVPGLVPTFRKRALDELTEGGLWLDKGDYYEVHDFLDWNRSRVEIEASRERLRSVRSAAGKKGAAARWQNQ